MTADEIRDLFSPAYDGELDAEQQRAFDEALERDAELRREYEGFRAMLAQTKSLAVDDDLDGVPPPDLVASVQDRIRRRSRGRYYRDRFASARGPSSMMPLVLGIIVMLTLGLAYFVLNYVQIDPPAATREHHGAPDR